MILKHIRISNFRSIGELDLELSPLTVLVGPNASGKSNVLDALQFVKELLTDGLDQAVGRRQGARFVRCRATGAPAMPGPQIELTFVRRDVPAETTPAADGAQATIPSAADIGYIKYAMRAVVPLRGPGKPRLTSETVRYGKTPDGPTNGTVEEYVVLRRTRTAVRFNLDFDGKRFSIPPFPVADEAQSAIPMAAAVSPVVKTLLECVGSLQQFDIAPESARAPSALVQEGLSVDGSSLATALHAMRTRKGARESLLGYMTAVVPGFADVTTSRMADGRVTFHVAEEGIDARMGPNQVSDGTVRLLCYQALLTLASPKQSDPPGIVCVEEAERGLHPWLIAELAGSFRTFTDQGQAILTTHSAAVVDAAKPDEVVIVEKVDGMTTARRASDDEDVEVFLKRFTLGELWHQGELGGTPI